MRLLLTVVTHDDTTDLVVDTEDDGTVADLAATLAARIPAAVAAPATAGGPPTLQVVPDTPGRPLDGPPPELYLGDRRLAPEERLVDSAVRHGAVLGIGLPVPEVLAEPRGLVEVRVSGGSSAGRVVRWDPGEYTVGADSDCDLVLDDPLLANRRLTVGVHVTGEVWIQADPGLERAWRTAPERSRDLPGPIVLKDDRTSTPPPPRRHWWQKKVPEDPVRRALPDGVQTVDASLAPPLAHLERRSLRGRTPWPEGETLSIGSTLLRRTLTTEPDASLSPSPAGGTLDYNRPPRLLPPSRRTSFSLPQKPEETEKQPFPLAMAILPALMGVGMYMVTKNMYTLLIIAISPMMAISSFTTQRKMNRRMHRSAMKSWTERMRHIQSQALDALIEERTARRRDFADPGEALMTAVGPRSRLWERRPTDPDWMVARFGTADQVSEVTVSDPSREQHEGKVGWTAPDVPVTVSFVEAGVVGIAGPRRLRTESARWVIGQAAMLHSPTQLSMVLMTTAERAEDWSWIRWLPHLRADPDVGELARLGVDEQTWSLRINELSGRLAAARESGSDGPGLPPVLVVLDGARSLRMLPGMVTLLQAGPSAGVHFLCLDEDPRLLPEECQAVTSLRFRPDGSPAAAVSQSGRGAVEEVRPDLVSASWAERLARAMAPVRDVTDEDASSALPSSSRLLDVLHLDVTDEQGTLRRWQQIGRTTKAVIGEGAEGAFAIDIRRDGPHGLVAGTTGSGKSELLQSIIASLAASNRPDEMNYVLVDYKGGAAFKDCNHLPHTVGMVTDLDGHLTTRALESLGAELRRREHQLAEADAKDIEDYLAAKGPQDEPMPRLLIIIDEFAALVAELPDFVTGLVDIARRGRSLGVHLILATQRPAGVVSAEIKSNTNLRIALRVTDSDDSNDVIESPAAAEIAKSTPGRGYARLGHSSLIPFQTARVGGRPKAADAPAALSLRSMDFGALGARPSAGDGGDEAEEDATIPSDLATLVAAANAASEAAGIAAPPPPWLPPLPESVTLDDVIEQFPHARTEAESLRIPFALSDIPREQRRDLASYDLADDGHLAIVGAGRSGRSYVLRALAGAIGSLTDPRDVHVYGVDCGNNALMPLVSLPHVGAVVTRDQVDRLVRLQRRLLSLVSERQQTLATQGFADIAEQRSGVEPQERLPYVVVLFDRWEGFYQAYESIESGRVVDGWMQLLQEGASVGVKIVVTGDRTLTMGRISTLLEDKLMLRMLDPNDFMSVGLAAKQVPASMPDGRAFRARGTRELHVVLHDPDPTGTAQVAALHEIGRAAKERHADLPFDARPFRVDVLPPRITVDEARTLGNDIPDEVIPFAVAGDTLAFQGPDALRHGPGLLVTGPRASGRSTTLLSIATTVRSAGWKVVLITPRLSALRALDGAEGVHGCFTGKDDEQSELTDLLEGLRSGEDRSAVLVDDLELVDLDGWLGMLLQTHLDGLRDSGSVLVGAGSPVELASSYRGLPVSLKRSGSGFMLCPQSTSDTDMFGVSLPRSSLGQPMPAGSGYLVRAGQVARAQVALPESEG